MFKIINAFNSYFMSPGIAYNLKKFTPLFIITNLIYSTIKAPCLATCTGNFPKEAMLKYDYLDAIFISNL